MIQSIEQWVKGLFLLLIGISFLEILLPRSAISKYVSYVFSMIILASILLPVASGFEEENLTTWGSLSISPQGQEALDTEQKSAEIERTQTKQIAEVYREKTALTIQESLFQEFPGISQLQVVVYIDENVKEKSFGQIRQVEIRGRPFESDEQIRTFVSRQYQIAQRQILIEETKEETDETADYEKQ